MFTSIYEKFQNVQDQISIGFRELKVGEVNELHGRELNSGALVLAHYQENWKAIHDENETNIKLYHKLDKIVTFLKVKNDLLEKNFGRFESELENLDAIIKNTEKSLNTLGVLRAKTEKVEKLLSQVADSNEIENFEKLKEQERIKIKLYKEHKLDHLDKTRAALSAEHDEKVKQKEAADSILKMAKSREYERLFKRDMENYKEKHKE